jgi:5-bromo-4-chloroindolyl phosphate hydrolysis protein
MGICPVGAKLFHGDGQTDRLVIIVSVLFFIIIPTIAQVSSIKINIKIAPTCFSVLTLSSGSKLLLTSAQHADLTRTEIKYAATFYHNDRLMYCILLFQ